MNDEVKNTFGTYLGPDFQLKLIWQLLVEPEFCKNVIKNIGVEYFDDPYLKRLFIIMYEYYKENDKVPNLQNGSIEEAIHKYKSPASEVEGQVLTGKLDQIKLWNERVINKNLLYDGDVVRNDTVNFIKQQEYRKLAENIISKVKTGEIRKPSFTFEIEEKINKIYHIGDEEEFGIDVLDNIDDALSKEFRETIPTGIEVIDAVTGNGLGKGEVGLILAPSGVGKTTFLTKIANSAFNDCKKVLQIVFEDTEKQIQRKHFANWSKIKLSDIDENTDEVKRRVVEHVSNIKKRGGKLDIVRFSEEDTSLFTIKNWIARQEKKFGYKYDMIVLDYLDCLEPNKKEKDLHAAELAIIKSFIAMAADYDIPCWGAIQSNRSGFKMEFVEEQHVGGNIKRLQKSHFVMSVSKPDKTANLANIKILKARFAQDGHEFKDCIFNNDTQEIRVTDKHYIKGLKVKHIEEDDLEKIEDKILKLEKGIDHGKLSGAVYDNSETIGGLRLKEGVVETNNDIKPNEEFSDDGATEGANEGVNNDVGEENSSSGSGPHDSGPIDDDGLIKKKTFDFKSPGIYYKERDSTSQPIPEESSETLSGFDVMNFLNTCGDEIGDNSPNEIMNYLAEQRDYQGNIMKE